MSGQCYCRCVSEKVGADYNFGQYSAHNSELYSVCVCACVLVCTMRFISLEYFDLLMLE